MTKRISSQPKKKKKEKKENKPDLDKQIVIVNNIQAPSLDNELRTLNLYGDITEKKASDVTAGLLYLENSSHTLMQKTPMIMKVKRFWWQSLYP